MAITIIGEKYRDQFSVEPGSGGAYNYATFSYGSYGSYKPGPTSTGLPNGLTQSDLTVVTGNSSGDINITAAGVYDMKMFQGRVVIKTSGLVLFTRCYFAGKSSWDLGNTGVIDCENNPGTTKNCRVYDSVLAPSTPSIWANGISGHDFIAERCNVFNVCDGFDPGNALNAAGQANAQLRGNWVHDLAYFSPDATSPTAERDHTHNDCIQWFGGANLDVVGNFLDGRMNPSLGAAQLSQANRNVVTGGGPNNPFADPTKDTLSAGYNYVYPAIYTNSAIQITQGTGTLSGFNCDSNWFGGGGFSLNIGGSSNIVNLGSVTNNRFIRTYQYNAICSPAPNNNITVGCTFSNNVYDDTGALVSIFVGP